MSDLAAAPQLIAGFYNLEDGQWRWAKRRFAVVLPPPPQARKYGATLELDFFLPSGQIEKLGPISLFADVSDHIFPTETYTSAGAHIYERHLTPEMIGSEFVTVVFTFDKALTPSQADGRELAAVIKRVSLL